MYGPTKEEMIGVMITVFLFGVLCGLLLCGAISWIKAHVTIT